MGGKTTTQESTQRNEPPEWARPALERAGQDAMSLYDQRSGYNTYQGPTQAPLSDMTLAGMNNALAATGYQGAPVSNQSIDAMVPDIQAIMQQIMGNRAPMQQQNPMQQQQDPLRMASNMSPPGTHPDNAPTEMRPFSLRDPGRSLW